ncbi:MAG: DUF4358 domain-containing protein [Bacilli bacterium]|nr:DUF4358 domain-containing protein [Bacilli bacterium]
MKIFKKISLIVIMLVVAFAVTGCGSKNIEGSLEDIMTKLYAGIPEDQRPMMLMNTEVNEENVEYFLGTKDIEYEEALASEPGIGSIAHSVVLVRVKDGANVEAIEEKIEKSINPRKWVCVGVEEDDVIVESEGNLIALIMIEDEKTRDKIEEAFDNLK